MHTLLGLTDTASARIEGYRFSALGTHARVALFPGDNWLHFAIPTPVIVNDRRLRAESVLLNFSTGDGTVIKDVHVYDGDNLISRFDNVNSRSGLGVWHMDRWRIASPPEVFLAIGISVNAVVSGDGVEQPFVVLGAAGCDFIECSGHFRTSEGGRIANAAR